MAVLSEGKRMKLIVSNGCHGGLDIEELPLCIYLFSGKYRSRTSSVLLMGLVVFHKSVIMGQKANI